MALRFGAVALIVWGTLNGVGGFVGARHHPAAWVGIAFVVVGALIAAGGVAFLRRRKIALPLSVVGLAGLSVLALASGVILRGPQNMRILHHAVRLAISCVALGIAVVGVRRERRPEAR